MFTHTECVLHSWAYLHSGRARCLYPQRRCLEIPPDGARAMTTKPDLMLKARSTHCCVRGYHCRIELPTSVNVPSVCSSPHPQLIVVKFRTSQSSSSPSFLPLVLFERAHRKKIERLEENQAHLNGFECSN